MRKCRLYFFMRNDMKVSKVYILRIDDERSIKYAKTAADSCDKVGISWEYFEGLNAKSNGDSQSNPWNWAKNQGIEFGKQPTTKGPAACATAGHFAIWKRIVDNKECAIVLEHDALLLHKLEIDIPDNNLVVLGYKVKDPQNYNHEKAGPPSSLEKRTKHGGAHSYAITHTTAKELLNNVKNGNRVNHIDNQFFLTGNSRGKVEMKITNPICALGWLRESTIWGKSAVDNYMPILDSFKNNYNSKESLGEKKGGI